MSWMIYGAYGFTAKILTRLAIEAGHRPILAGRNEKKTQALGEKFDLETRCFDLGNSAQIQKNLEEISTAILCAGPFVHTSPPFLKACLQSRTHYLDITGELGVLAQVFSHQAQALKQGICVLPGVGFDVVPTDCVAAQLKSLLPNATSLELAFAGNGPPSGGTLKTMVEHFSDNSLIRRQKKLEAIPFGSLKTSVDFSFGTKTVVSIPWGDLFTAFESTEIENITTYTKVPTSSQGMQKWVGRLAKSSLGKRLAQFMIGHWVSGPSEDQQRDCQMEVWGKVTTPEGKFAQALLRVPEGYRFTALSALHFVEAVEANQIPPGCHTPSQALGPHCVEEIAGTQWIQAPHVVS